MEGSVQPAYHYLSDYTPPVELADDTREISTYNEKVDRGDPRLRAVLASAPAISLHDHPFRLPADLSARNWGAWRPAQRLTFGYEGMAESGMTATVACTNSWHNADEIRTMLARLNTDIAAHDGVHVVHRAADLDRGRRADGGLPDSLAVILGLESMTQFAHDVDAIEVLFGLGVRVGGLIYSDGSMLGGGLSMAYDEGLTGQGRAFVRRMNEVGMVVDLAHAGDRTTLDAIEASTAPVMISHAGSRSLWPTSRMKPDDVLLALRGHGGLVGVEAPPNSTPVPDRPGHDIDAVMAHVDALVELLGIDSVALGPDVVFGPHHQLHRIRAGAPAATERRDGQPLVEWVDGVENPKEAFWNITWWLMDHGWSDEDIRKVVGGNAHGFLRTVLS
jgi:membrane dipeptidase